MGHERSTGMDPSAREQADQDPVSELTSTFSETARILFSAGSVHSTLEQVVAIAVETIEGCDFAGLFITEGNAVVTPVLTDPSWEVIDTPKPAPGGGPGSVAT